MFSFQSKLLIVALLLAVGGSIGAGSSALFYRAEIADIHLKQSQKDQAAQAAASAALLNAQRHGDELSARLARTESALNSKTLEVSREVSRLSVGRNCLGADLVSLLNHSAVVASGVEAAPASAPVAADAAFATDADVGQWVALADGQYSICRARLDALIDWFDK